jgi:hypothetical protein
MGALRRGNDWSKRRSALTVTRRLCGHVSGAIGAHFAPSNVHFVGTESRPHSRCIRWSTDGTLPSRHPCGRAKTSAAALRFFAAACTGEVGFDVGEPDIIGPTVGFHMMAATMIAAIDIDVADAGRAHVAECDLGLKGQHHIPELNL